MRAPPRRGPLSKTCSSERLREIVSSEATPLRQAASCAKAASIAQRSELAQQPALGGDADEVGRGEDAHLRMRPSRQCLEHRRGAVLQGDDRLEVEVEALLGDRDRQLAGRSARPRSRSLRRLHPSPTIVKLNSRSVPDARRKLEQITRYDPAEVEQRVFAEWERGGYFHPPRRGLPRGELLGRDPASQRDRGAAHGPRAERLDAGRPGADAADAGAQHALDARHRPRRDRHPGRGREGAARGGHRSPRARAGGIRGADLGLEGAIRLEDRRAVQAPRRLLRLRARALHPRRGLRRRGPPGLRLPLREGLHLPRPLPGQLGPRLALGDLRPRGREPRGHRHPLLDRLPGGGLREGPDRGHGAPGDDAGRHRRRRQPRRRALPRAGRRPLPAAPGRPPPADHRRRARRPRVRHRGAEDHPRPRPQRLRDRPRPRAGGDQRDRRGRADDRRRRGSASRG